MKTLLERTRPPTHPGEIILWHHMKPLNLSVTEMAKILKVSRKTLSKIVNKRGSVTPDMALRLSRAFNTSHELWIGLQQDYDLWHAYNDSKAWKSVKPLAA